MTAPEVERRIADALVARTQHVYGDPDSLRELQRRLPTTRRRFRHGPMLVAAAAVVLIVAGATYLGGTLRSADRASSAAPAGRAPAEGTGYRPTDHFVAVTRAGRSVIVRADGTVVRTLARALRGAVLSPDGNRVYGVVHDPKEFIGSPVANEHVAYIDLADNHVIVVATKAGTVTGLSLSADGGTIAYALLDRSVTPERTTIFLHDLRRDRDWSYRLPVDRQVIPMSLSPDGSRLALTETHTKEVLLIAEVSNPRAVVDADPTPADLVARPVPLLTCRGIYYNPRWTGAGLFAVRQCGQPSRTDFSIVRLDPDTGRELTVVVRTLSAGGVSDMQVLAHAGGPTFLVGGGDADGQPAVYVVEPGRATVPRRLPGLNSLSAP